MTFRFDWRARTWGGLAGVLMTLGAGLVGLFLYPGETLVHTSYDLPVALRYAEAPTNAVIVFLDKDSHDKLEQPLKCTWDRRLHAQLVRRLKEGGAKLIVFDIVFEGASGDARCPDPQADDEFARAIRDAGNVILAGVSSESMSGASLKPHEVLAKDARGWGMDDVDVDADGTVRQFRTKFDAVPSLAVIAATQGNSNQLNSTQKRWLQYYQADTIDSVSYYRVISNATPAGFFNGRTIFVGARQDIGFTGSGKDTYKTPWTKENVAGVQIHATMFLNLIRGNWLTRMPVWAELLLVIVITVLFGYGLPCLSPLPACGAAVIGAALIVIPAHLMVWRGHVWFAWLVLLAQIGVALAWSVVFNSVRAYVENRLLESSLAFHLSPARVKQILKNPELLKPGAEKQEVSIMFTDITDFSTVSDRMLPEQLFQLLNSYFEATIPWIYDTEGTVVDLIGDSIFAVWNAPETQTDHHERACRAALLLCEEIKKFEGANKNLPLKTRVGLHAGVVTVGNCGSAKRFTYTALGAETNMASRLEGLNKHLGTQILASSALLAPVKDLFVFRPVGHFRLKGADRVIEVNELIGTKECEQPTKAWRDAFADGLGKFKHGELDEAELTFRRIVESHPKDGPANFYLRWIAKLRSSPLPSHWLGEVNMEDK